MCRLWASRVAVLILLAGCGGSVTAAKPTTGEAREGAPTAPVVQPAQPEVVVGFASVSAGTRLRIAPKDNAPAFVFPGIPDPALPGAAHAFKVLGESAGFVELESLEGDGAATGCSRGPDAHDGFHLRWYVTRAELNSVVTQATTRTFDDGTGLVVLAGSPAQATDQAGLYTVNAAGLGVVVDLPPKRVGKFYERAGAHEPQRPIGGLARGTVLWGKAGPVQGTRALAGTYDRLHVFRSEERADGSHLLTFANRCAELSALSAVAPQPRPGDDDGPPVQPVGALDSAYGDTLVATRDDAWGENAPAPVAEARGPHGLGLVGTGRGGGGTLSGHEVADGARVYWPDGSEGGRLTKPHFFLTEATVQGARTCFPLPGAAAAVSPLRVCFDPDRVTKTSRKTGSIGLSNLGRVGGARGDGWGPGAGFGERGKRVPRLRMEKATVKGPLDKDIVRRIVRSHINELRFCYTTVLNEHPEAGGRVTIEFEIDGKGKVANAEVDSTTFAADGPGECMAKAVARWEFPAPSGSETVTVLHPFALSPG